jgi:hypothetical protein
VQHHHVGLGEELGQLHLPHAVADHVVGVHERVHGDHLPVEQPQPRRDGLADTAQPDDARRTAGQPARRASVVDVEPAARQVVVLGDQPAFPGQDHRERVRGHLVHAVVRHVEADDPALTQQGGVEVVGPDALPGHDA